MKKLCILLLCMIALAGCNKQEQSPEHSQKMTPPIEANIKVDNLQKDVFELSLEVKFLNPEYLTKAVLEESGVIKSAESSRSLLGEWRGIQEEATYSIPIKVKADGYGKGSVRVRVEAYDQSGTLKYGMNPKQYFLVTKEEVLTGNNGYTELELLHLTHLKDEGKISEKEYEKRKEEITKGNGS